MPTAFHIRYQPSSSSFVPIYVGVEDVPRSVVGLIYGSIWNESIIKFARVSLDNSLNIALFFVLVVGWG